MRPTEYNAYPYARRRPKDAPPEHGDNAAARLKRDLRELEKMQAERPLKPPGGGKR